MQFSFQFSGAIADRYVEIYLQSESYDQANDWAKEILGNISDFDAKQLQRIIADGSKNAEITGSFRFSDVISAVQKTGTVRVDELNDLLKASGLGEYVFTDDPDIPF
jgi:hypothetical protein